MRNGVAKFVRRRRCAQTAAVQPRGTLNGYYSGPQLRSALSLRAALRQRLRTGGRLRTALSQTLLASLAIQLALLVSGVAVARALGPVDRGHFAFLTLIVTILSQLGGLGIPYALTYTIARSPASAMYIVRAVGGPLRTQLIVTSIVAAGVLVALSLERSAYGAWTTLVVLVVIIPEILFRCGLGVLQGLRRFQKFNLMRIAPIILFGTLATTILVVGSGSVIAVTIAWAVSRLAFAPMSVSMAWREARAAGSVSDTAPETSQILQFGRKAMLGAASPVETYRLDQAVVGLLLPPVALGYYVVALAFTNLPRFVAQSFGMVAGPLIGASSTHGQARRQMWRFFWLAAPFYLAVAAILWVLAPSLTILFFGEEFDRSASITRILLIATVLFCARRVLIDVARAAGYAGIGSIAEVVASVAALPLIVVFAPIFGTNGVAYALVGSSALALSVLIISLIWFGRRGSLPGAWLEGQGDRTGPGGVSPPDAASGASYGE